MQQCVTKTDVKSKYYYNSRQCTKATTVEDREQSPNMNSG